MLNRLLRWGNALLILFTLVVYLVPHVHPKTFWPMALLGPVYPWLLLLHLGFIGFWALSRKAYFLMSLTCLLLGWNHFSAIFAFRLPQSGQNADIRVMSYNMHMLQKIKSNDEDLADKKQGAYKSFMAAQEPLDALCLQECSDRFAPWMARALNFPHSYTVKGTTILSRHPILDKGAIIFDNSFNSVVWADIQVKGRRLRVYSAHLQSNSITSEAKQLIDAADLQQRETWVGMKGILRKYKTATRIRAGQAEELARHIALSPWPAIVGIDLNDTPVSFAYRHMMETTGLKDSFREKGSGLGFTFGGVLPALRIDFLLSDPRLLTLNHDLYRKPFSDHYPILAEYAFPE
jgi:endonuclease/exonuclease/phosphatase family metal-dependent hydrolase